MLWDKMPGESAMWYSRFFEYYLPFGPERTLLGAYNRWRQRTKAIDSKTKSISRPWWDQSKEWDWKRRAEAWDEENRRKRREEETELARLARKHRRALLMGMVEKIKEGLSTCDTSGLSLNDLVAATTAITEELRREYDEEPPDRVSIQATGLAQTNNTLNAGVFLDQLDKGELSSLLDILRQARLEGGHAIAALGDGKEQ